jgi:acetyl-CoA carboxylase biotin carboxyl carrier protein
VSSSFEAIKRVIAAFEQSDWSEIDVRAGDVRIQLSTDGAERAADPAPAPVEPASMDSDATPEPATPDAPSDGAHLPDGAHIVVAPSPGIFWRSPEPGAPPFADVGDAVEPSTTVCIVEVMKLMNHLKSSVRGEVVAVYGRNGVAVQQGEPLFAIAPAPS